MMNNDLISRSALIEHLQKLITNVWNNKTAPVSWSYAYGEFADMVVAVPAVDAEKIFEAAGLVKEAFDMAKSSLVPVVRCKDCKWLCSGFDTYSCAKHTGLALIKPDGSSFCSYGERRSDDAD